MLLRAALLLLCIASSAAANDRVALVIGNAAYGAASLKNSVNDARAIARTLREIGFEVTEQTDADQEAMLDALQEFLAKGREARVRLFYYAGHGTQYRGRNFLVPARAALRSEDDLERRAVNATEFFERLGSAKGVSIAIVDACREAPFPLLAALGRSRTLDEQPKTLPAGFAPTAPVQGTIIAFSTAPGKIAYDGQGEHGTFTKHLLANIARPGLPIEGLLKRVRSGVLEETRERQVPWETSSLVGDFCFVANERGICAPVAPAQPAAVPAEPQGVPRTARPSQKRSVQ